MSPRWITVPALAGLLLAGPAVTPTPGQVSLDFSLNTPEASLRFAYGEYFRTEPTVIYGYEKRGIRTEEVPVALYLAQRVRVSPEVVISYRLQGMSWLDITLRVGGDPEIFYVPVPATVKVGPPYGKAYGYYRNKERGKTKIVLTDAEVVDLVHLRFVSEHYGYQPEEVIRMREQGKPFRTIVVAEHEKKRGKGQGKKEKGDDEKGAGKGKGKGKGRD